MILDLYVVEIAWNGWCVVGWCKIRLLQAWQWRGLLNSPRRARLAQARRAEAHLGLLAQMVA